MKNSNFKKICIVIIVFILAIITAKAQDTYNTWHLVAFENEQVVAFYNTEVITDVKTTAQQVIIVLDNGTEFSHLITTTTFGFDLYENGIGTATELNPPQKWNVYYANGKLFFSEMINWATIYSINGVMITHFTGNNNEYPIYLRQGLYVVQAGDKSVKLLVAKNGGDQISQPIVGEQVVKSDVSNINIHTDNGIKTWCNISAGNWILPVEMSQVERFLFRSENEIEYTLKNRNSLLLADYKKMEFDITSTSLSNSNWNLELTMNFGGVAIGYDTSLSDNDQYQTHYVTAFSDKMIICYDVNNNFERRYLVSFIPSFETRISIICRSDNSLTPAFSRISWDDEEKMYVVDFHSIENGNVLTRMPAVNWPNESNFGKVAFSVMETGDLKAVYEEGGYLFTLDALKRIEWEHVGAGGGGAQFNPTINPHDPNTVFVTCDMGGSFVTYNGGVSWRMFNLSHSIKFFVFDPIDPDVVYAQSYGLFKSEDKGHTWRLFYPDPSDVEYVVSKGDHASESFVLKDGSHRSVQVLAIDPEEPKSMYAVIQIDQSSALYSSADGGNAWMKEKDFEHDVWNIFIDPASPLEQRSLYLTWSGGVDQRINGQWNNYSTPGSIRFNTFSGGYNAHSKTFIIYALSGKGYLYSGDDSVLGVFISIDGGKTWENRQEGLLKNTSDRQRADLKAITTCSFQPSTVYVSYNDFIVQGNNYGFFGVAKSEDYGLTWTFPWYESATLPMSNYSGCWLSDRFSSAWGGSPFSLGVAATNVNICYGSDYGRTIKTVNGGQSWEAVYTKKITDGSWTTTGIEVTTGYDVVFDPFDVNHIFFALTDIGLMESKNGGQGWLSATRNNGVSWNWANTTYAIAFDPEVKGQAWAAMSGIHDLPVPKMFQNSGIDKYTGGIMRTNDGSATWQVASTSIGEAAMTHILLDPTSDKNSRTLYACAFGKGVYKSTNGGLSWTQKNNGITGAEPFAWRIERRESDGTLFLIVSRRSWNGSIGNDWDGALYRSTDGAETWTKMTLPEGCNGPTSLLTTIKYPKRIVLSAWGRVMPGSSTSDIGGGIYTSDDDGKTWVQVMERDQHIYAVSFDSRINRYYACGFNASVYYSEDGATNWIRSRGFNFKWGHRVIPDPRDTEMVYVVTFGGGVWHGPAKGDPEATEDLLTILEKR